MDANKFLYESCDKNNKLEKNVSKKLHIVKDLNKNDNFLNITNTIL